MSSPRPALLYGAFGLVTLIWGTTWAAIRVGLEAGLQPFTGVMLRFALAALLLFLLAPFLGVRFDRSPRVRALWALNAVLNFALPYGVVHWGEQWVPSGLASILFATYPLMVALLAHPVLPNERLRPRTLAGIAVGFAGVAVIFSEDLTRLGGARVALAAAVMLLAPFSSAITTVAIKRWGAGVHPFSLTAVPMGLAAGLMGLLALGAERTDPIPLTAPVVLSLLYLTVFGTAVTFTLYFWMLSHWPATRLSLMTYIIPVVAVIVGTVLLDERFTARTLAGSGLVLAGIALATRRPARRHPGPNFA